MEQLLKITTTPIAYELKIKNARLERKHNTVDLNINRAKGGLKIQNRPSRLRLDSFNARASLFPTTKMSVEQAAERGRQQVADATARYVIEGERLMRSKVGQGGEAIHQMIVERCTLPTGEFQLDFIPKSGVDISATQAYFNMQYEMDKLTFDWRIQKGNVEFIPGEIEMNITQYPDISIEYVGDPLYVPPSAAPNYEEE